MNVSGSPGATAAQQLMQATSDAVRLSMRQLDAVNNHLTDTKAKALENTAQQEAASAERKSFQIDLMA
jgi:hypothetical protein